MTKRARSGKRDPSGRRHVALYLPRDLRRQAVEAAEIMDWSVGDWILAAMAEHGPEIRPQIEPKTLARRESVEDAVVTAIYITNDERIELDDSCAQLGMNRSAAVTEACRLAVPAP